ncbi:copper resistance protein CopC [Saxibacter everestensis]|uniref:Copper resistance protein CopC n=1 Tax=Saxibacter everestensis TaxID=2909229 RepID=A0ABY8QQH5_9MICO|nr:copper resistance protein CopC [Brevibacteriaceae bacterium ZFBP1038]
MLAAVSAVALLTVGLFAVPASAHDRLVSSSPADGETVKEAPGWIELNFSSTVKEIGSEVQVNHEGTDVSAGELAVEDTKLTVALPTDLKDGDYTVVWRTVSSDGHPISGEYSFEIATGGGSSASESAPQSSNPTGAPPIGTPPESMQTQSQNVDDSEPTSSPMATGIIVAAVAVGVILVVLIILLIVRRRQAKH